MSIRAFLRSLGVSFRSTPARALEVNRIGYPDSAHWYITAVAIRISRQVVVHRSLDCLCLAADFTAKFIFSHALRSYP